MFQVDNVGWKTNSLVHMDPNESNWIKLNFFYFSLSLSSAQLKNLTLFQARGKLI